MSDEESTTFQNEGGEETNEPRQKKRKLHTYEKARLAYEKVQEQKQRRKEIKQQRDQERDEALAKSKQMKIDKMKILTRRTKRGQPKLDQQVEFLLKKIEKNVAPKEDNKNNNTGRQWKR